MTDPHAIKIDPSVAHPARRYNYWLGGKDNFEADRVSGDAIEKKFPNMRHGIRANRAALVAMTEYLAGAAGIRQFLDIGTGLPTADNTHEVAQRVAPTSRVLYVDNDPLVMVHARALLTSTGAGVTDYIQADLRNPRSILNAPQLRDTLDLTKPVALMLIAVLHFIPGDGNALPLVRELMDALPSGSYLAATHFTLDFMSSADQATYRQLLDSGASDIWPRGRDEFTALFNGMELIDPGTALVSQWGPENKKDPEDPSWISIWSGVARKP